MEISVIGSSKVNLGRANDIGFCNLNSKINNVKNNSLKGYNQSSFWSSKSVVCYSIRSSSSAQNQPVVSGKKSRISRTKPIDGVKLYVGLPLDTVSNTNTITHGRAIAAGLKALKLLGVYGVELPIWWGIAEKEANGKYDWAAYLAIAQMVQQLGLKLHVSLCFHGSQQPQILLPEWVSGIGESDPSIYFTDRSGQQYKGCLSLGVDDLPVLDGKTPIDVYKDFCDNFKTAFAPFMGSTITGLSIGLGPDGELRYPSHHHPAESNIRMGAGEFQCYDRHMLNNLKHHAETNGNPLWGLGGPHDAPSYDQSPLSGGFFHEKNGSWETPYGDFFLSWYSSQLLSHGDRLLSVASSTFNDTPVALSGKIPLIHSWYKARSHPSELTAGIYNTVNRNGYDSVVEILRKNSCKAVLAGLDLSDEKQPAELRSSPESLLAQIRGSCRKNGVAVAGQNSGDSSGFEQVKKNLLGENGIVELFTYQRMGAYFFSPEHFPCFTEFVRGLNKPSQTQSSDDDLPVEESLLSGNNLQMLTT